ncbi:hypothetical protein EsDP_00006848 [Epichloe bromicola]|uniref:Rhodopsin domain-containing protein n=1 Tax=Epichloe bromicola TaxID=79588 RepID=A0ABQ0CZ96_9HYPO
MAATPFQVEAWAEYAVGVVILLSRIAYRTSVVGRDWHGDDYFAAAAVLLLTGETAMLEMIGQWGSIVGMTDEEALSLSDAQKSSIVKGAKADIAGWCLYVTLIWCLKGCMLFFYRRLTTDLLILYIPLPLLWVVQMPWSRKVVYGLWLTTGIFVIVASLLRCVLSIKNAAQVDVSTIWAIRETFVGIISVNAPILGPWIIRKFSSITQGVKSRSRSTTDANNNPKGFSIVTIGRQSYRLGRLGRDGGRQGPPGWTSINNSEEHIADAQTHDDASNAATSTDNMPTTISTRG